MESLLKSTRLVPASTEQSPQLVEVGVGIAVMVVIRGPAVELEIAHAATHGAALDGIHPVDKLQVPEQWPEDVVAPGISAGLEHHSSPAAVDPLEEPTQSAQIVAAG